MSVGRTVEQLKKRRHAYLGPYIPPAQERNFQYVDPAEEVGQLKGIIGGVKHSLIITLGEDFWIGRRPECDLTLDYSSISNFHMRIYAVRTSCQQSLICIHDLSTNGFILNDIPYRSSQDLDVGGKACSSRSVIIRPGDVLRFPDSEIELVCRYFSRHSEATQTTQHFPGQVICQVPALFPSSDSSLTRTLHPWIIQNFTLGTGSFGRVHLATHREIAGLQVACKTVGINPQIEMEIQVLKGLDQPNVCGIYDMFREEQAGMIHLFLPLVSGGDLFSYLEKHGSLTEDEGKFAAFQLLKAIEFLHEKGIAHRDVKPENILLHKSGAYPHLLLADFGLATTSSQILSGVPATKTQMHERHHRIFTGTSLYVPPERLKAILSRKRSNGGLAESVHGKAWRLEVGKLWFTEETMMDIWAVGIILYLIMTGAHPYDDRSDPHNFDTEPGPSSRTTTRRQSSARSWEEFRSGNPTGSLGEGAQTEQELEWRRVASRCSKFINLRSTQWEPAERWVDLSTEARSFVAGLLNRHPTHRLTIEQAKTSAWLEPHQAALEGIYHTVVIQGKLERAAVWNENGGVAPITKREIEEGRYAELNKAGAELSSSTTSNDDAAPSSSTMVDQGDRSTETMVPAKKTKGVKRNAVEQPSTPNPPSKKTKSKTTTTTARPSAPELQPDTSPITPSQPIAKVPKPRKYKPEPRKANAMSKKTTTLSRRASSIFLPNAGIFADLDDIEEEEDGPGEEVRQESGEGEFVIGTMTLNDVMAGGGANWAGGSGGSAESQGASGSGSGSLGRGAGGEEESFPPTKAGQRKTLTLMPKKSNIAGPSKFLPASKLAALADAASLRPSDLAFTLSNTPSSLSSDTVPRRSSFLPPNSSATVSAGHLPKVGSIGSKRPPGVVLKRVEKV